MKIRTSRDFAIDPGGRKRISISWTGSFTDLRVAFDGADCAALDRKKVTGKRGDSVQLPDGSTLVVRTRGLLGLEVRRDGVALPGSDLDPRRVLRNAALLLTVMGAVGVSTDLARWQRGNGGPALVGIDVAMLAIAAATYFGQRIALAFGIAAVVAHVGMLEHRTTWSLIFAVVAAWLLGNHFFAVAAPAGRRSP